MNIDLKYFSGTGNSYKIIETCKQVFNQNGYETEVQSITEESAIDENVDLIGFCFPVYAFGIPRICRKYLSKLPKRINSVKAFLLITAGAAGESGFAVKEGTKVLRKRGFDVVYSAVIHMPSNWTVSMNPPPKEEAQLIINAGVKAARRISKEILKGVIVYHKFNYPPKYSKFGFYKDYYLFKWLGVNNLWRNFRTDETCDSCELCSNICPTGSIQIVSNKPKWFKSCEQCMRCVNYCPKQAIFQNGEGSVKGKNIYHEPSFRPKKLNSQKHMQEKNSDPKDAVL